MSKTGYKRVYEKHGAYWFVDRGGKWHRLCAVAEGEPAMVRALSRVKNAPASRPGSMSALIAEFRLSKGFLDLAEETRYDYGLMLVKIEMALREHDVVEIDAGHVLDLRDQWKDKPRSANKYQSLLSLLMSFAIVKRMRKTNPTLEVKKLVVKKRKRYLTHDEFLLVRQGLLTGKGGWKNASGEMMACLMDLAYLTGLRMKDLRLLAWDQVSKTEIFVEPTKTRNSSGAKIEVFITPSIAAVLARAKSVTERYAVQRAAKGRAAVAPTTVIHNLKMKAYSKDGVETAWTRACERAGVPNAWFRDLRPKALSDAKRAGVSMQVIQDSAGHLSVTTTEEYLRGFDVKKADLALQMPVSKLSNSSK